MTEVADDEASRLVTLRGGWDEPTAYTVFAGDTITLSGWAHATGADSPRVEVRRDGELAGWTVAELERPDVATTIGPTALMSGWAIAVEVDRKVTGTVLEVELRCGNERHSLGRRRLWPDLTELEPRTPPGPIGGIDEPRPGAVVEAGALMVEGWTLVGGMPADVIDVHLGGNVAVRAHRCAARPDIDTDAGLPGLDIGAGFSEVIPIPARLAGTDVAIRVVARGMNGARWRSHAVVVHVANPRPEESEPLPVRSTGPRRRVRARPAQRACVFTHSLNLGGAELYLLDVLRHLATTDFEVWVVSPSDGPLRQELERLGMHVHLTGSYAVEGVAYESRIYELGALLSSWNADVVLANTLGVFPAVDAAQQAGVPTLWAIHESFDLDVFAFLNAWPGGMPPFVRRRWEESLQASELVVFESRATEDLFRSQVEGLRTRHLQYGIDTAEIARYCATNDRDEVRRSLGFEPHERVLLCMGVFQERKGQLALLLAFAQLAGSHPDATLVLVGEHRSDYSTAVRRCRAELGLEARVRIVGVEPDIDKWYRAADVLVSASDTESLPRSILQAMAFGLPSLAADVFGVGEAVEDGVNGWLFEGRSGVALVAGLYRALTATDDEIALLGRHCRESVRDTDGLQFTREWEHLLRGGPR